MVAELLTDASRATDANSNPYSGAKWYFYATGTTTPQSVYTTSALNVAHANPVVADSGGKFAPIYFDSSILYRGVLKNADDSVTIYDIDPINAGVLSQLTSTAGAATIGTSSGDTVQEAIDAFDASIGDLEQVTTAIGVGGNAPSVIQFSDHNFLNSQASASAVAAGTVDQPNINGAKGYITTFTGDGTTDDFVVTPGFTVDDVDYRNILVYLVIRASNSETLQTEDTHYTVAGKGTGSITITMLTPPAATEDIRVRVYRKENSAYSPLLNFAAFGYDNFNDGSGSQVIQFGAHHVNIGNTGGHNTFAGGAGNTMRGSTSYSFATSLSHDLNACLGGAALGIRGRLTGTGPVHFGASGKVGNYAAHFGDTGEAETTYSAHFGRRGKARIAGDITIGNGAAGDSAAGMADIHRYPVRRTLTSTTTTSLIPPTGTSTFVMDDNSTAFVRAFVTLVEPSTADFRVLQVTGTCQRGAGAGTTSMTGASAFTEINKAAALSPSSGHWEALIVASTGAGGFGVFGKGSTGKTIIANAIVEVTYINHSAASV